MVMLQTRFQMFLLVMLGTFLVDSDLVSAQSRPITAQEYIQSTSPLPGGGSVTSRSAPGQKTQTITTIAQLPSVGTAQSFVTPTPGFVPKQFSTETQLPSNLANQALNSGSYPYPTNALPNYTAYRQVSTLNLGPAETRVAQNCATCNQNGGFANQSPALPTQLNFPVPNTNVQPPPPPVSFQQPNLQAPAPTYQPNFQPGTIGTPQYGAQGANWYTPFVTGSGVYTPIIKLGNLPPGTYLGQGWIGQPTAYVDGQPFRNLLRYLSP